MKNSSGLLVFGLDLVGVSRSKDFEFSGNYVVKIGSRRFLIYRDPENRNWYLGFSRGYSTLPRVAYEYGADLLSVTTKKDAIARLLERAKLSASDINDAIENARPRRKSGDANASDVLY